tara:strand:+ start:55 stop:825 length:771 start_codon:yes stop_codon:yes gene_type:complete
MKYLSALIIFFLSISCFCQQKAYGDGEWLKFRIHYGLITAGQATLEVKSERLNNQEVFHIIGFGETTGLTNWFFKVEDHYQSYILKDEDLPLRFVRNINEGGYKKDIQIDFNQSSKMATIVDFIDNKREIVPFPNRAQDMVSSFYYLRNNLDTHSLNDNDEFDLDMFFDSENYKFKLKYLRKEVLDTKFGKVPCLVFRPYVESGRVFNEKESLTIWVSDDDNKIPLLIKADLLVGSLKASLIEFKKLNNSFKIFVE